MKKGVKTVYFKFKNIKNHWFILFEDERENKDFIYDDIKALETYFKDHQKYIFISGGNYYNDEMLITSLIKNRDLVSKVTDEDVEKIMPFSLDVTQEILKSVNLNLDLCAVNIGKKVFNYNISDQKLSSDDLNHVLEELSYKILFIKELFTSRTDYFNWRLQLIEEYQLPLTCIRHSKGRLMTDIVNFKKDKKIEEHGFMIDPHLEKYIKSSSLLSSLYLKFLNHEKLESKEAVETIFGNCFVKFIGQGIKGGLKNYIDCTGKNNYLYIDFNSFGPSILINNHWLEHVSDYPLRYQQLRDRRIWLKEKKDDTQEYYKRMINSFIDSFFNPDSDGYCPKIGKSISITGYLIMALVYEKLSNYNVEVIDANTDGLIVKCEERYNKVVKQTIKKLTDEFHMSCDVEVVKKISHKNTNDYCMLFEDGTVKKIGIFGKKEDQILQSNSMRVLSEPLVNYYLFHQNQIIRSTIESYLRKNDVTAFQKVMRKNKRSKVLYTYQNGEYIELTSMANRLFVVSDSSRNPVYVKKDDKFVLYNSKVNYEVVNDLTDFDIKRLDINYYQQLVEHQIELIENVKNKKLKQKEKKKVLV